MTKTLTEAGRTIRNAMYKLQSISGKPNVIEDITDGYQRHVELVKGIPYCAKVSLIEMRPPL